MDQAINPTKPKSNNVACKKSCADHLGNRYESITEMCKHYNIKLSTFTHRIKVGWDLKLALETPTGMSKYTDSEGNKFASKRDLAHFHGMSLTRYYSLLNAGYTLEDDKQYKFGTKHTNVVIDPLGRKHKTLVAMLKFYDIPKSSYIRYVLAGLSTKDLLMDKMNGTLKKFGRSNKPFTTIDHLGNTYDSISELCRHYNIVRATLKMRLLHGQSLEEALTGNVKPIHLHSKSVKDYLGNTYSSIGSMCKHYNITRSAYNNRIKNGWSIEATLTTPVKPMNRYKKY